MDALVIKDLRKVYSNGVEALKGIDLTVREGDFFALLGPNGAGKTTCFYMIVGLVPVDAGRIYLDESELTHLPIHRRARLGISYLPQENSVFRRLTVEECAAIQSFPQRFTFHGPQSSRFCQIGNAVPPLLAQAVAEHLLEVVFQAKDATSGPPGVQRAGRQLEIFPENVTPAAFTGPARSAPAS